MADFDFSTLNSSDLEKLVGDLLNAKHRALGDHIEFKTFKDGKDKGIDLLYSTKDSEYEIVGQVKHYYRSGYKALATHLKKTEAEKVNRLRPKKYLFATSVDLSVANTEEIRDIFHPYLNSADILGKAQINAP
ncbi:restriction endonuclease [Dyadobacter sp. CY327]|uniref:restriction endonuclease n=1 Tax=Dyadobacter sp. CY327 TaxID=2907301 RepID=UPI001F319F2E|nr:restriction endonuclease [Dyadobacter sp. CY327]MCE7072165.1 restriction endonuclease [Dyadobacter sp. CY327]